MTSIPLTILNSIFLHLHCIEGTVETEIIPELTKDPGEIISKNTFSSFYYASLDDKLYEFEPETIVVCGVYTNICVLHAVIETRNRGYKVEIPVDCVASFDKSLIS